MNNPAAESNSNISPEWEERLIDFSFGAMGPESSAEFERGLDECTEHVRLARQYRTTVAMLGQSVAPAEPLEGHKARFLEKLVATPQQGAGGGVEVSPDGKLKVLVGAPLPAPEREKERDLVLASAQEERIVDLMQARARRQGSILAPALAIAAALALLVMGAWLWSVTSALTEQGNRTAAIQKQLDSEQALRLAAERRLSDFAATLNVPPGYTAFPIQAQPGYNATATVLYNPNTKDASLLADRLESLPPDKVYEFWLVPSDPNAPPQAGGTFTSGADGAARHATVAQSNVGSYAGFAVTLENSPGVSTPQGPKVLAGTFR